MKGYFIPADKINELQQDSIERVVPMLQGAHYTNLQIRINGAYEYEQADWLKHMLTLPDVDEMTEARVQIAALTAQLKVVESVARRYIEREMAALGTNGQSSERSRP